MDFDIDFTAGGFVFSLLLMLGVYWIAHTNGFFRLPKPSSEVPVNFKQTLGSFLVYLVFSIVFLPVALVLAVFIIKGQFISLKLLSQAWISWTQVVALWVITGFLLIYCLCLRSRTRHFIFWGEEAASLRRFLSSMGMGMVTFVISYPFVLFVGTITKYIALKVWGEGAVEQVAVKQLEQTMGKPFLFAMMILAIVFVVPFAEELLFRGFLQNFFKRHFGRNWAIVLSSVIFSCAHFAVSQGTGNFQLITTLCVLAFFLGFLYERQRTLWASYGLHMTFNALNILLIVYSASAE